MRPEQTIEFPSMWEGGNFRPQKKHFFVSKIHSSRHYFKIITGRWMIIYVHHIFWFIQPNIDGEYFMDRNPEIFALILDYLRTGVLNDEHPDIDSELLMQELEYFMLPTGRSMLMTDDRRHIIGYSCLAGGTIDKLVYKATRDGFAAEDFHERCDDKVKFPETFPQLSKELTCIGTDGGYHSFKMRSYFRRIWANMLGF